jgi:hypothetical protein
MLLDEQDHMRASGQQQPVEKATGYFVNTN